MPRVKKLKPETKYFPQRLMEQLEVLRHYPLTLVEAPAGYGKTTALKHFFDVCVPQSVAVYWHTFREGRPEPSWEALCIQVARFDPISAERLMTLGAPCSENFAELDEILQNISCDEETYLVLDDFAVWNIENHGAFLMLLSNHGGRELHIVAASQLLSRGQHGFIRESNRLRVIKDTVLAFQPQEMDAYYREAGISLTAQQLGEVAGLTEGWVMALYLQLISFIERGQFELEGMEKLMKNTLWNRLPDWEKEFLLKLSIFPRFSLAQAAKLSGKSSEETENLLREKRVFIHFDRESRKYYLHSLFHRFLGDVFMLLPLTQQRSIYLLGGDVAQEAGDRISAVIFYYHSGEWERLYAMPLSSFDIADVIDEKTKPMILDMLESTPREIKVRHPQAMVPLAFTLFFVNEHEKLAMMQEEIQSIIEESDISLNQKNALLGEIALLLSFLQYNRIEDMSALHRQALELLGGTSTLISIKSTWTFGSPSVLYMFWRESGKLDEELIQMDECMPIYYRLTAGHGTGAELIMRAEAHFLRGEVDEAEILCHRALFTADSKRQNSIYQCGLFLLSRIAILRGDGDLLQTSRDTILERSWQNTEDLCRYTQNLADGYLCILLKRFESVAPWLQDGEIGDNRLVIMTQPFAHILYGRLLLERGEYQKLLGVSQYVLGISSIFPNLLPQLYTKLYMAQAFMAMEKQTQAVESLNEALAIALPDGIIMPFAETYDGIHKLLPHTACPSALQEQMATLAQMLEDGLGSITPKEQPLSPREQEVYELLCEGLTNPQIASKLFISVSTVKMEVSRVLRKKGASSREILKIQK